MDRLREIRNHPEAPFWFIHPFPISEAEQDRWERETLSRPTAAYWAIQPRHPDGPFKGIVGLRDICWEHRSAEVLVAIHPDSWLKGWGHAGLEMLRHWVTAHTCLHRLWAEVLSCNQASCNLFVKAGYQHEGLIRHKVRRGGEWRDCHIYGRILGD